MQYASNLIYQKNSNLTPLVITDTLNFNIIYNRGCRNEITSSESLNSRAKFIILYFPLYLMALVSFNIVIQDLKRKRRIGRKEIERKEE